MLKLLQLNDVSKQQMFHAFYIPECLCKFNFEVVFEEKTI